MNTIGRRWLGTRFSAGCQIVGVVALTSLIACASKPAGGAGATEPDVGGSLDAGGDASVGDAPMDSAQSPDVGRPDTAVVPDTATGDSASDSGSEADVDLSQCPDDSDPDRVRYISHQLFSCERADVHCESGWLPFDNACGCGCVAPSVECPGTDVSGVVWVAHDVAGCIQVVPGCPAGGTWFAGACGCGCRSGEAAVCAEDRIVPAGAFSVGSGCGRLVVCLAGGMTPERASAVTAEFADAQCSADPAPGCPEAALSSCSVEVDIVDATQYAAGCSLTQRDDVVALVCEASR